jgi:hypothetical protein
VLSACSKTRELRCMLFGFASDLLCCNGYGAGTHP